LERDIANSDHVQAQSAAQKAAPVHHFNPLLIAGIAIFAAVSFYLSLVVATNLDHRVQLTNRVPEIGFVSQLPGVDEDCTAEETAEDERTNILVLGLDLRRDEDPDIAARTDTVFVLTIDECDKRAGVLSIPRDLAVEIPVTLGGEDGYFTDRINTAYVHGENDNKGDGPKFAVEAVEYNFDIEIDHYAVLNFNNFIQIVDELGGITVDVPEYVWDPLYSDCNSCGYHYVEFDAGLHDMDGETALTYARLRHSDNDFKRIERQQLVMKSIARKASDLGVLVGSNPLNLYNAYKDSVKTDISDVELGGLALTGKEIGVDNILFESLAEAVYPCPYSQCNGAAMLLPIPDKVAEVKARLFADSRLQNEGALIKVVNGTPTPKLGESFAAYLRSEGIPSDRITIDEYANGELYDRSLVIDHGSYEFTTAKVIEWLGLNESHKTKWSDLAVEQQARWQDPVIGITVVLGSDASIPEVSVATTDYYEESYDTYYTTEEEPEDTTDYVPEEEAVEPEPTLEPEPEPEPTPEPPPEPTPEPPPPEETPPPEGAG
jgi:LCP family protein required for cell wall assembly